ncbi:GNAT family N-acetyltransferase [Dyadobacter sediminis]|uniref:GNAT family N-acetyltransferase n=1 Tax=Dyadobacter sediminis TaxID=1493691 RepID=A0A5R9KKE0_9BACT|nr:GNAT family N-acetyltransferase [Dyadobacter sediminis]TLU96526.1 GNAT family N-acetyltransferase [Dyadobacter sediminis]GGB82941.1 N-acetyltransferase [Dyadobacter sediminis]
MIQIIPFHKDFQNQIVDLILNIQQIEFQIPITAGEQPDLFIVDEFYRKNGGQFWLAIHKGQVVGSIALIRIGNHAGVIRKMFVQKEFRGKEFRIAQLLFDTLEDYCVTSGIRTLYLGTIDRLSAAIRFYEKNGFEKISKEALPEDFPLMPVDNVFCRLNIRKFQS